MIIKYSGIKQTEKIDFFIWEWLYSPYECMHAVRAVTVWGYKEIYCDFAKRDSFFMFKVECT